MWTIKNIRTELKTYKFWRDELETYTAVYVDGELLFNMVEVLEGLVNDDQAFQSIVCEQDGIYQCEFGSWLMVRQISNHYLLLPYFTKLVSTTKITDKKHAKYIQKEYAPPKPVKERGAIYLDQLEFKELCSAVPALFDLETIMPLSVIELFNFYKWDLPAPFFGDLPIFNDLLISDDFYSIGKLPTTLILGKINSLLNSLLSARVYGLKPLNGEEEVHTLNSFSYKDISWDALCQFEGNFYLLLGGKLKIIY